MSSIKKYWREFAIAIVANLGTYNTGYAGGWFSPVESKLENPQESPLPEAIDREQAAWIGSLIALGGAAGAFFGGPAAKYTGRKWGLLLGSVPLFIGWLLLAAATHVYMIYAGRISFGIALGIIFTTLPMYCGEIASNEVRGAVNSIMSVFIVVGTLTAFALCPYLTYSGTTYFGVGLCSVFAILLYFMPESPFYYLIKGDRESARQSLVTLRGKSYDDVEDELNRIAKEVEESLAEKSSISDLFANRANIKALYICCGLLIIQPFTGFSVVQVYAVNIFQNIGLSIDPFIATMIFGVTQVVSFLIALAVIDRWGRRILLMVSASGMFITLTVFGVYSMFEQNGSSVAARLSFAPLVLVCLNVIIYSIGVGPVPWALVGELFDMKIRPMAGLTVTFVHWLTTFLILRYFYTVVDSLGMHIAFWIFAGASLVGLLFTFFLIPETKGRSFQEIQDILQRRKRHSEDSKMEIKNP